MNTFGLDLRVAWRHCVRRPTFALTAVSTLALTIGATTALFAMPSRRARRRSCGTTAG